MARGSLRRRAAAWATPVLLVAACSADPPSAPTTVRPTTTSTTTTTDSTTATTSTSPSATGTTVATSGAGPVVTTPPVSLPTQFVPINQVVKDPQLGHEIKVNRIVRALPWPDGYSGSAAAYELVGVEMTWTPGVTYTAALRLVDFSIATGSQFPNRPDPLLNPALVAAGWPVLPAEMPNGQSGTGWVVFKVDPKDATSMRLDYTRPPSRVTDTNQTFPKQVFSVQLVPAPAPASATTTG